MPSTPLKFKPKGCPLPSGTNYTVGVYNPTASSEPYPDGVLIKWSDSGWLQGVMDLDGCPPNLPPGQACAIIVDLSDSGAQALLAAGETFDAFLFTWSSDYIPEYIELEECGA